MTPEERRQKENKSIIKRMRLGQSLAVVDSQDTWWPPRAIIKKDKREIARVLNADPETPKKDS